MFAAAEQERVHVVGQKLPTGGIDAVITYETRGRATLETVTLREKGEEGVSGGQMLLSCAGSRRNEPASVGEARQN